VVHYLYKELTYLVDNDLVYQLNSPVYLGTQGMTWSIWSTPDENVRLSLREGDDFSYVQRPSTTVKVADDLVVVVDTKFLEDIHHLKEVPLYAMALWIASKLPPASSGRRRVAREDSHLSQMPRLKAVA
jgi:hypothetical protein